MIETLEDMERMVPYYREKGINIHLAEDGTLYGNFVLNLHDSEKGMHLACMVANYEDVQRNNK